MARLIECMPRARLVVAGDFIADEYVYGETDRISREAPVLIVRYERSELKAGGAANVARNLAALGVKVRAVGVVGDDDLGTALLEMLASSGIDVGGIQVATDRATEAKTRILAGGRSTRRQQVLRVDRAPAQPITRKIAAHIVRELEAASGRVQAVQASDYGSGSLGPGALAALRSLKGAGVPVCVDSRYRLLEYVGVSMVKPNEPELAVASGSSLRTPGSLERAGRALLRRLSCDEILVTRGCNGMSLFRRRQATVHIPAHGDKEPVDVMGAGDTVAAAYAAAIAVGGDAEAAARIANVAGALVVGKPGTATVSREELLAEVLEAGRSPSPRASNTRRSNKIVRLEDLPRIRAEASLRGRTIALANGVFDLFHVGHLRYLEGAKSLADELLVAVNSDPSARLLGKGPGRPVVSAGERAEIVAALACVDHVILFDSPDVVPIIRALRPDVQVKGTDYTPESIPEGDEVRAYGGRVAVAGDPKRHSTTELIARLGRTS